MLSSENKYREGELGANAIASVVQTTRYAACAGCVSALRQACFWGIARRLQQNLPEFDGGAENAESWCQGVTKLTVLTICP